MRNELKVLRVRNNLTQPQMAERCSVSTATYNLIEQGKRRGSQQFWLNLQREFELKDGEVWQLQTVTI